MTNDDYYSGKMDMLKRILRHDFSLNAEEVENLMKNGPNYRKIIDYIKEKEPIHILASNESLFDKDQRFKAIDILLNPPWIRNFAKEFDVTHNEVLSLHESGMNAEQIRNYLDDKYPVQTTTPQKSDFVTFAQEMGISEAEAIEIYNRARQHNKDPHWLAETYLMNHSFEKIDSAFKKYYQAEDRLGEQGANLIKSNRINILSSIYSEIYDVDSNLIEGYFRDNYDLELLNNFLVLCDVNDRPASNEGIVKGNNYLHKLGNKIGTGDVYSWDRIIQDLEDFIEANTSASPYQIGYLCSLQDDVISDENIGNDLAVELKKFSKKYVKRAPAQEETNSTSRSSNVSVMSGGVSETIYPYASQMNDSRYSSLYKEKNETVSPASGSLSIMETDFSLPGKLGLDFAFTRVFSSSQCNLNKLSYQIETYYEEATSWEERPNYTDIDDTTIINRYNNDDGTYWLDSIATITIRYTEDGTYKTFENHKITLYDKDNTVLYEHPMNHIEEAPPIEYVSVPVTVYIECTRIIAQSEPDDYFDPFNLGKGWSLNFPKLEITDSEKFVWMDGCSYKINSQGYLSNLGSERLILKSDLSYSYDGMTSAYVLSSVEGDKWYFDSSGKLIAQKNKFDVYIKFYYTDGLIDKIIDSVGRRIQFTYPDEFTTRVSVFEKDESQEPLYIWNYCRDDMSLCEAKPPMGKSTRYSYNVDEGTFSSPYNSVGISKVNLISATKPGGAIDYYEYVNSQKSLDHACSVTEYKVSKTYTVLPTLDVSSSGNNAIVKTENVQEYNYTVKNNIPYSTTKTVLRSDDDLGIEPCTEYWQFDDQSRIVLHKVQGTLNGENRDKTESITRTYLYDENESKKPIFIKTDTELVGAGNKTTACTYSWDLKGNLIQEMDSVGRVTDYVYDSENNILVEKTNYIDPLNGKRISYELNSTKRNITSSKERGIELTINETGIQNHYFSTKDKISTSFIWKSPGEITRVDMNVYWSTGFWFSASSYVFSYKKRYDTVWTPFFRSEREKAVFTTSGTQYISFDFPDKDYYDIKLDVIEGKVKIMSGSFATGPKYEIFTGDILPYRYHTFNYDSEEKLIAQNVHSFDDDPSVNAPIEATTRYSYDTQFNAYISEQMTDFIDVDGISKTAKSYKEYDSTGHVIRQSVSQITSDGISSEPIITEYEYDKLGRLIRTTNPPYESNNSSSITLKYIDEERKIILTNEMGTKIITYYDGVGRSIYSEWVDSSGKSHLRRYNKYDSLGQVILSGDALYKETNYTYDSFGRLIKTRFADGNESESFYTYVFEKTDAILQILSYLPSNFNCLGYLKLEKTLDKSGNPVFAAYDVIGRLIWRASNPKSATGNQPIWDIISYEYDLYDRLIRSSVLREKNLWDVTEYEYNDITGNPSRINLPGNNGSKSYLYDSRGFVTHYEESDGTYYEDYEYDQLGRIIKVVGPETTKHYYNEYGKLSKICRTNGDFAPDEINMEYNKCGWITKESWTIEENVYSMGYKYDAGGNVIEMKYPDGESITYEHDELGRAKRIEGYFDNVDIGNIGFTYDERNNLIGLYPINGVSTVYAYDDVSKLISINSSALSLDYTYDPNGNVQSIQDHINGTVLNYEYDGLSRLTSADVYKQNIKKKLSYVYDGAGNRIFETCSQSSVNANNYLYRLGDRMDALWEHLNPSMISYSYLPGNRLNSINGTREANFEWDSMGKLQKKISPSEELGIVYNGSNLVKKVIKNDIVSKTYFYDPTNRRIKVVSDTEIIISLYRANEVVYEMKVGPSGDTTTTKYITLNGRILAKEVKHGIEIEKYFYYTDMLGSTRAITDMAGNIVEIFEYEPFGFPNGFSDSVERYQFTGKHYEESTGLMYFGARYYDSEIGRFITLDPANDGINGYVYCRNNPLKYIDPDGKEIIVSGYSPEEQRLYEIAIWKMSFSPTFSEIYEKIKNDPRKVYIGPPEKIYTWTYAKEIRTKDEDGIPTIINYEYHIDWNPYYAVVTTDGEIVLPMLCLAHEFGHIIQFFDGSYERIKGEYNNDPDMNQGQYTLNLENDCVKRFEAPIGDQLKITYRTNYEGHVAYEGFTLLPISVVITNGPFSTTVNVKATQEYYELYPHTGLPPTERDLKTLKGN